jgi:sugar phosphate isomerase/epimerase
VEGGEYPQEVGSSQDEPFRNDRALDETDYVRKLAAAGFDGIGIEPTRVYSIEDARQFLAGQGLNVDGIAPLVEGKFMSAFVRGMKPATGP